MSLECYSTSLDPDGSAYDASLNVDAQRFRLALRRLPNASDGSLFAAPFDGQADLISALKGGRAAVLSGTFMRATTFSLKESAAPIKRVRRDCGTDRPTP